MAQTPESFDSLRDTPLRFLESEQFEDMFKTYQR